MDGLLDDSIQARSGFHRNRPADKGMIPFRRWFPCLSCENANRQAFDGGSLDYANSASANCTVSAFTSPPPRPTGPTQIGQPSSQPHSRTNSSAPASNSPCSS